MSDIYSLDNLPAHALHGEHAPLGGLLALTALGLLTTLVAAWLWQGLAAPQPAPLSQPAHAPQAPQAEKAVAHAAAPLAPASAVLPACPQGQAIHFATGKSTPVTTDTLPDLGPLVAWAREHPDAKVSVEGHADLVGMDQANLLLSYQRAKAVVAMLAQLGVAPQQLHIAAVGSHSPIEGLPGNAHANRRVTIQVQDPNVCLTPAPQKP